MGLLGRGIQCTVHSATPEFLSKKHQNFGQGLEFLKFGQGNRDPNQQNRRKTEDNIRKNEEKQRKIDKKFRDRDPYFLLNIFLLKKIGVPSENRLGYFSVFVANILGYWFGEEGPGMCLVNTMIRIKKNLKTKKSGLKTKILEDVFPNFRPLDAKILNF